MLCARTFWAFWPKSVPIVIDWESVLPFDYSVNCVPQSSTPSKPPTTAAEKLEAILNTLCTFKSEVVILTSRPWDDAETRVSEYKALSDGILEQVVLELDAVETEGTEELREKRKRLVKVTLRALRSLNEIANGISNDNRQGADHDRYYFETIVAIDHWNHKYDEASNEMVSRVSFKHGASYVRHVSVQKWDAGYNGVITAEHWMTAQGIKERYVTEYREGDKPWPIKQEDAPRDWLPDICLEARSKLAQCYQLGLQSLREGGGSHNLLQKMFLLSVELVNGLQEYSKDHKETLVANVQLSHGIKALLDATHTLQRDYNLASWAEHAFSGRTC